MSEIRNRESIHSLKNCLTKEIKEIYVTGYSEIRNGFNFFSSMNWWYYIEIEDFFLGIEYSQTKMLQFHIYPEIKCNFELEENDVFTISPLNKKDYQGQKIVDYDLIYGHFDYEVLGLGIQCIDNRSVYKNNQYIFFNSLSLHGIEVGDEKDRDRLLEDSAFYLKKLS